MGHERFSARELIAGRYRPGETVQHEEGRLVVRGEDTGSGGEVLLVRSRPAAHPRADTPPRTVDRVMRETAEMEQACPGRIAHVLDVVENVEVEKEGWEEGAGTPGEDVRRTMLTVLRPVDGVPLAQLLGRGPMPPVRAARIGLALLDVLRAAHRRGITHGDLSPGQVFVRADGGVVLTGFGLLGSAPGRRVTAPSYAAPEQTRGECAGPSADLWSLGALLYAMVEGRPPFHDRGEAAATLRGVARLPLRPPAKAGPLAPAVTGLLRRSPLERVPEEAVRRNLTRILHADPETGPEADTYPGEASLGNSVFSGEVPEGWGPRPGERGLPSGVPRARGGRSPRRPALLGAALAVVASSVAVYATRGGSGDEGAVVPRTAPTVSRPAAVMPGGEAARTPFPAPSAPSASPAPSAPGAMSAPPSRPPGDAAGGFVRQRAPEGFSVDLPTGWRRVSEDRRVDGSYRVTFGTSGDPRTLVVTHSLRLDADPAANWAALEPALRRSYVGYRRLGPVTAVTYRGRPGADIRWLAIDGGTRTLTFGRGFLLDEPDASDGVDGHSGYSLRWTTPRTAYDDSVNRRTLDRILRTFRFPDG
ncbi:serine/threonine protein kinase [Streptomyces sp. B3I8]|uniref:serine/threonine protein kinase n=1 Tax=Streptomyces sp. B3I8 TaxID=3042303 RepID=UPI002787363D|nr:serine/threonine protein kinase [Streptomyces sp. B3I8]MDQ0785359.1 serine/threonine protein kinase [Streptomyces sp. B3I8]